MSNVTKLLDAPGRHFSARMSPLTWGQVNQWA